MGDAAERNVLRISAQLSRRELRPPRRGLRMLTETAPTAEEKTWKRYLMTDAYRFLDS